MEKQVQEKRKPGRPKGLGGPRVRTGLIRMEASIYDIFKKHCHEEGYYMAGIVNKLVKRYLIDKGYSL